MNSSTRSTVLLIGLCTFAVLAASCDNGDAKSTTKERVVLPGGTYEYPNSMGHPGDPVEAVKDFKLIYAALDDYRKSHRRLPSSLLELVDRGQLAQVDLQNPDWKYAEEPAAKAGEEPPACIYFQNFLSKRPDGTSKPAFPKEGELDVWVYSKLAARTGTVRYPDGSQDKRFSGFYVVLFSDGTVRKFKHKELFYVEHSTLPGHTLGFPGMTGYKTKVSDFADYLANKPSSKLRVSYAE